MYRRELYDKNGNVIETEERPYTEKEWLGRMEVSDQEMPRALEDIIDVMTQEQKDALATETMLKYRNKKTLRSQKPK